MCQKITQFFSFFVFISVITSLVACAGQQHPELRQAADTPDSWQANSASKPVPPSWLATLKTPFLEELVVEALKSNYPLAQEAARLKIANERVTVDRADRLPILNLSLSGQRSRVTNDGPVANLVGVNTNFEVELDIWGKLSDAQRAAELDLAAQKMRYLDTEQRLVAGVVSAVFNVISAEQLAAVFDQRFDNLGQSLDVIEKGYRSGLNEALDVYLARNSLEQERANVANQQQVSFEAVTSLELLIADYPGGKYRVTESLPDLVELADLAPLPGIGIPSDLLKRRPDVQEAWLNLLALDASLAVAHKNRFPSLNVTASLSDSDSAISRLLDGGSLAFSIAASLVQPLFQGGRLRALEEQARLSVEQAEQRYLEVVFAAFAEVENELSRAITLEDRYNAFLSADTSAANALTLAFDQYQRGLVNYTTVLESQRRAFDAQTTVVQLQNQRLQSRVALFLALGGNF